MLSNAIARFGNEHESHMPQLKDDGVCWRRVAARCGCTALVLSGVLHIAMWIRVEQLHGFWNHLSEASRWFQMIDLTSLLAVLLCLFGTGWQRWLSSALGLMSFLLCCGYAAGL